MDASPFDTCSVRGWRIDAVRYLGGHGPGWYVALRDAAGRRLAEGEGDTERDALTAALAGLGLVSGGFGQPPAAATKAAKIFASAGSIRNSGCHCTPSANP